MKGPLLINEKSSFDLHIMEIKLSSGILDLCRPGMSGIKAKRCLWWVV